MILAYLYMPPKKLKLRLPQKPIRLKLRFPVNPQEQEEEEQEPTRILRSKLKLPVNSQKQPTVKKPHGIQQEEESEIYIAADIAGSMDTNSFITITFGEVAETHVGMSKEGSIAPPTTGLTPELLQEIAEHFEGIGYKAQLINLASLLSEEEYALGGVDYVMASKNQQKYTVGEPHVLIIRKGVDALVGEDGASKKLFKELKPLPWDQKAKQRGKVVNKRLRHNLNFADYAREPDYEEGVGRVINFADPRIPRLKKLRENLVGMLEDINSGVPELKGEGNHYYDSSKCCINFHGDAERRIVIAARFGATMPIRYQWHYKKDKVGKPFIAELNNGDIYFMSEKAVGTDWMRKNHLTLRHAAGCDAALN